VSRTAIPAEAFDHGDARRYRRGCRCRACTTAVNKQNQRTVYLRATGRGLTTTPDRAADHLAALRAAGTPDRYTIQQAGIAPDLFYRIVRREGSIHRATETRVLGVAPAPDGRGSGTHVPSLGTVRRLRALAADGWPAAELGRRTGKAKTFIVYLQNLPEQSQVRMWVADYVRELYQQLRDLTPESEGVSATLALRSRKRAASRDWSGSAYWDDDALDDPTAQPAVTEMDRSELAAYRREEIAHLASFGIPEHDIAARLGMSADYVTTKLRELRTAA
jgi:hypothetical protein